MAKAAVAAPISRSRGSRSKSTPSVPTSQPTHRTQRRRRMSQYAHSCVTPRCKRPVRSVFSRFCTTCRQANRKTGAPGQKCVKKAALRPYVARAKRLIKRRNSEKIEAGLRTIHATLLAATQEGSSNRFVLQASQGLAKVLNETSPLACGLVVAAVALLRVHDPLYFANERTFEFALVRAFRSQGSLAYGSTWDHKAQRTRLWYRAWPERSTAYAAMLLKECYVPFIGAILTEDRKEAQQAASARAAFNEGFASE